MTTFAQNPNDTTRQRPFSVYVASGSGPESAARVRAAVAALEAFDIKITCTWAQTVAEVGDANPRGASAVDRRGWSVQCCDEIDAADAVWFLVPTPPLTTRGAWFESGYAFNSGKHLVFSGDTKQSIFGALGHEFESDTAALACLKVLRDRARVDRGLAELADNAPEPRALPEFDVGGDA